jgi:hypothetical protein
VEGVERFGDGDGTTDLVNQLPDAPASVMVVQQEVEMLGKSPRVAPRCSRWASKRRGSGLRCV